MEGAVVGFYRASTRPAHAAFLSPDSARYAFSVRERLWYLEWLFWNWVCSSF